MKDYFFLFCIFVFFFFLDHFFNSLFCICCFSSFFYCFLYSFFCFLPRLQNASLVSFFSSFSARSLLRLPHLRNHHQNRHQNHLTDLSSVPVLRQLLPLAAATAPTATYPQYLFDLCHIMLLLSYFHIQENSL